MVSSYLGEVMSSRTLHRLAVGLLACVSALVLAIWAPGKARADGFETGCNQTPASGADLGSLGGISLQITSQTAGQANPKTKSLNLTQALAAMGNAALRAIDADGDGANDLRWDLVLLDLDGVNHPANPSNLLPLFQRLGSDLPRDIIGYGKNPWVPLTLRIVRLDADPNLAPVKVDVALALTLKGATQQTIRVELGYDSRPGGGQAPATFAMNMVFQAHPALSPNAGFLGFREAATYTSTGLPSGQTLSPGQEPPLSVTGRVGSDVQPDEDAAFGLKWDKTPAQFAMVIQGTCVPSNEQVLATDLRSASGIGATPETIERTVSLNVTTAKTKGIAGHPEMDFAGSIGRLPDEATLTIVKERIRFAHQPHGGGVSPMALPDLKLDSLVYAPVDSDPATVDKPITAGGEVSGVPRYTVLDGVFAPTGAISAFDLRFCDGPWGTSQCDATAGQPVSATIRADNVLPGSSSTLPPVPEVPGQYVSFASRDTRRTQFVGFGLKTVSEQSFRLAARLEGVRHIAVQLPANGGVKIHGDIAGGDSATVRIDTDTRSKLLFGSAGGSAVRFDGTVTPLPKSLDIGYTPSAAAPVDISYDTKDTPVVVVGHFKFNDGQASALEVEGQAVLGAQPSGMPTKGRLVYETAVDDLGTQRVRWIPNGAAKVLGGMSIAGAADRKVHRWTRVWFDATVPGAIAADWRTQNGDLADAWLRPWCAVIGKCDLDAVIEDGALRVVSAPIPNAPNSKVDYTLAPVLPERQHPQAYPVFNSTDSVQHVRYVANDDGNWGVDAFVRKLKSVRYRLQGVQTHTACVLTGAPEGGRPGGGIGTGLPNPFLVQVFVNQHTPDTPEAPVYVDARVSDLPNTLSAAIDDWGPTHSDSNLPWLRFSQTSCDLDEPLPSVPTQLDGIQTRVLAKVGSVGGQATMAADPAGKAPLALGFPAAAGEEGAVVHGFSDPGLGSAFDVAGRIRLPDRLVVFRPRISDCLAGDPVAASGDCPAPLLPSYEWRGGLQVDAKIQSTLWALGSLDALVRARGGLPADSDGSTCNHNAKDAVSCDTDVTAHVDRVPGNMHAAAKVVTNTRIPGMHAEASIENLYDSLENPALQTVSATVRQDAYPVYAAPQPSPADRVDNYAFTLLNVGQKLALDVAFEGSETRPGYEGNPCPAAKDFTPRGRPGLSYLRASLDLSPQGPVASSVQVTARQDWLGRFNARVDADTRIAGTVNTKFVNVAQGMSNTIDTQNGSTWAAFGMLGPKDPLTLLAFLLLPDSIVDVCIDVDIPVALDFYADDVRFSQDGLSFEMNVPHADQSKENHDHVEARFEEIHNDGSVAHGAWWAYHHAKFDPALLGDWEWSSPGQRDLDVIPIPYWNYGDGSVDYDTKGAGFFTHHFANGIGSDDWFVQPGDGTSGCCIDGTVNRFMIDPLWNSDIRKSMNEQNIDPIYWPGWSFWKALWDSGRETNTTAAASAPGNPADLWTQPTTDQGFGFYVSDDHKVGEEDAPELYPYMEYSSDEITGKDGTKYRLVYGMQNVEDKDSNPFETHLYGDPQFSLQARYPNGQVRWTRPLLSDLVSDGEYCGVHKACMAQGEMRFDNDGLLRVHIDAQMKPDGWETIGSDVFMFDPSGMGGDNVQGQQTFTATQGVPATMNVTVQPPPVLPMIDLDYKRVWYFGDGRSLEQGNYYGAQSPVQHVFSGLPDTYHGVVVYYALRSGGSLPHWEPVVTVPIKTTVQ